VVPALITATGLRYRSPEPTSQSKTFFAAPATVTAYSGAATRTTSAAFLATIYLVYTEGHAATAGDDLLRPALTGEAIRIGRTLVALLPDEPEAVGLLALMVLTEARAPARLGGDGELVRLADQDRSRWDRELIAEGHQLLRACLDRNRPGPYQIQAAIAAVHADATTAAATDWAQIVALYDHLQRLRPNALVALNRAIAVMERRGPAAALDALDQIHLPTYHLLYATRAEALHRTGRNDEAADALRRAIALTSNATERRHLQRQLARLGDAAPAGQMILTDPQQIAGRVAQLKLTCPTAGRPSRRRGQPPAGGDRGSAGASAEDDLVMHGDPVLADRGDCRLDASGAVDRAGSDLDQAKGVRLVDGRGGEVVVGRHDPHPANIACGRLRDDSVERLATLPSATCSSGAPRAATSASPRSRE
jgi:tetratricopeptide (TPR) repeat protein